MQSLGWYIRRLRSMSAPEIAWRLRNKTRALADRRLLSRRAQPRLASILRPGVNGDSLGMAGWPVPDAEAPATLIEARQALLERADRLLAHRIDLFDLHDLHLGETIEWNREYKAGKCGPPSFAPDIDYRDYTEVGDCKFLWEINRHQHWVVLARAWRLSGNPAYASEILGQLDSWAAQCPYGRGMNWRSPLELGIRIINWAWALHLISNSGLIDEPRRDAILKLAHQHFWDINRNYSRFSSANNHLVGEAAGVFIASHFFAGLAQAERWRRQSRAILEAEIVNQNHADGGNREQAVGYHLFVLEFFLLAGLTARDSGEDFRPQYWSALQRMFEFLAALLEGGPLPLFGDCDDGYVLDLESSRRAYPHELLAVGAVLFDRADWAGVAACAGERVWWLLGEHGHEQYRRLRAACAAGAIASKAFPHSGRYLLQNGARQTANQMSVLVDCGELGMGAIAAHGHADALSVTVRINGADVLVDPGTYDYFTYRPWRDYFRSTRAHNTVVVDGHDQSEMLGLFLWGSRAECRCVRWEPCQDGAMLVVEHDGYRRLHSPVEHRRTVRLEGHLATVLDELSGQGEHTAELYLHFAPECRLRACENGRFEITFGAGSALLRLGDEWEHAEIVAGSDDLILGWTSRSYHNRVSSPTLRARAAWTGGFHGGFQLEPSGGM